MTEMQQAWSQKHGQIKQQYLVQYFLFSVRLTVISP